MTSIHSDSYLATFRCSTCLELLPTRGAYAKLSRALVMLVRPEGSTVESIKDSNYSSLHWEVCCADCMRASLPNPYTHAQAVERFENVLLSFSPIEYPTYSSIVSFCLDKDVPMPLKAQLMELAHFAVSEPSPNV